MQGLRRWPGFTLVELLVVLAIAGTIGALVGPNLFRALDSVTVESDLRTLRGTVKSLSHLAFINDRDISVKFSDDRMHYWYLDAPQRQQSLAFETLRFPLQEVKISRAGFPWPQQIRADAGNEATTVALLKGAQQ
ncbi:type II secretion system GspH family protein [Aestuariibacter halophilus]|uniref:Type II secretion system GspH family protein n=1 Tax=Fluctibacter halophilus TaxID=226011 RepID=A0ABS8G6G7_9ALTE|nr:type II secretion system protein [Aestuariibacter halophilus]MCC2614806.1 type II secretion system GspH family protein [Aestuariibacter halophilus]